MITPEGATSSDQPYWHRHDILGKALIAGKPMSLYLREHIEQTLYSASPNTVLPAQAKGRQVSIRGQAYAEAFDFTPNVTQPDRPFCIGRVQAWYYPDERLLKLWTGALLDGYRAAAPRADALLGLLWDGFGRLLTRRFQRASRLITPANQEGHQPDDWAAFLHDRGFRPLNEQFWYKGC